jgi:hypothetical protein
VNGVIHDSLPDTYLFLSICRSLALNNRRMV